MKKTYLIPEMETIEIQTSGMLAASLPETNGGSAVGPGMAPGFDFDEEDEEDY